MYSIVSDLSARASLLLSVIICITTPGILVFSHKISVTARIHATKSELRVLIFLPERES